MRIEPDYPPVNKLQVNVNDIVLALENYDLMKSGRWPVNEQVPRSGGIRSRYPGARDYLDEILRRLQHCGRDGRLVERYYVEYRTYDHAERELKCLYWINDFTKRKWGSVEFWRSINTAIRYIAKTKPRRTQHGFIINYQDWKNHRYPNVTTMKIDTIKNP